MGTLIFLLWWWGGFAFALWAWARAFDEIDIPTIAFAFIMTPILGPVGGLLWGAGIRGPLWKRTKRH